jgi:hypothetical protein
MERTMRLIDTETKLVGLTVVPPCDADGNPR